MKLALFIMMLPLIVSCSNTGNIISKVTPYNAYVSYIKSLNSHNYKASLNMLSRSNNLRFNQQEGREAFDNFFPFFSSINTVVVNEKNHYQTLYSERACLTVLGFDSTNEPASVNFELLNEGNKWRFSFVQMVYHESITEFPHSTICPKKQ